MKTIQLILIAVLFSACNFNQSINKDLVTGATSRGDGLGCDNIRIQINGKTETRNTFSYGENVVFIFDRISGFKQENGNVYPEMSMIVLKKENQMVLSELNLLNLAEGTNLSPLQLQANLTTSFPYQNNEKYEVQITIWDTKGDGKFTYNMPFTVQGNENLKINATDITYKSIFIWNETNNKVVADNKMNKEQKYLLVLEDLGGLKVENGKVFPSLSIYLTDNKGNEILSNPNLFSNISNGFDAAKFAKGQTPITLTFTQGEFLNPCKLNVVLKDTKSNKTLKIETELEIE